MSTEWIKHKDPPFASDWTSIYRYNGNIIIHDKENIYIYVTKTKTYKLVKEYNEISKPPHFWVSGDISPFYNKRLGNSSFYLFIMGMNCDDGDIVTVCDIINISPNHQITSITQIPAFMDKCINNDPARVMLTGKDSNLLFMLAHSNLDGEADHNVLKSASLEFKFIIYNLSNNEYQEREYKLAVTEKDFGLKECGGDFHLAMIYLDVDKFLMFGEDLMFYGVYDETLSLKDDNCLIFEKVNTLNKLSDTGAFVDLLWSFSCLRYGDYVLKIGGDATMGQNKSYGRQIAIYDINKKEWKKSEIELPKHTASCCTNNVFIDKNNYLHIMNGNWWNDKFARHYTISMDRFGFNIDKNVNMIRDYWIRNIKIEQEWVKEVNLCIYKYYLFV